MRREQVADRFAEPRRAQTVLSVAVDVLPLLDALDDRRVGRGTPDPVLLEFLYQRGLGEARLGLGLVRHALGSGNLADRTFQQLREPGLGVLLFVVASLEVDGREPRFERLRRRGLESDRKSTRLNSSHT